MRRPIDGNPAIISPFGVSRSFMLNGKPYSDVHNGADYGVSYGNPVKAPENGRVVMMWDSTGGGNMVILYGVSGLVHFLLHNSRYEGGNREVKEGDIVAYVGNSGNVTGTHFHWGIKQNGVWIDPEKVLNPNLNYNNSYQPNMETITVNPGEGLFSVAQRAGLPGNEEGAKIIYNLNQGHRGSWDWQSLNSRMGAGDVLRVKLAQTPSVNVDTIKNELKAQYETEKLELVKRYQNEIFEANTKAGTEIKSLQNELEELRKQMNEGQINSRAEIAAREVRIKELEDEIEARNQIVKEIEETFLGGVLDFIEGEISEDEKQVIRKVRENILTKILKGISKLFDKIGKPYRPVAYIASGVLFVLAATTLLGVDWVTWAQRNPSLFATIIATIMTSAAGNQIIYMLSYLGGKLREEGLRQGKI